MKIILVVGTRPNFVKVAPLIKEFSKHRGLKTVLVHTGQHYDYNMSKVFFEDLDIPEPDVNLEVGSGSLTWQTSEIMKRFEKVCMKEKPDLVMVVGDVNSTLACALVAAQLGIKLAHIEAGLRSFDRTMPEEINRVVTDSLSDIFFVTEKAGVTNLINEGIPKSKIHLVGDTMIDSLIQSMEKIMKSCILKKLSLSKNEYAVCTLHRPSNVDSQLSLGKLLTILERIQKKIIIVLPLHPRTEKNIKRFGFSTRLRKMKNLIIVKPQSYLNFLNLVANSKFVLTDSGGIQGETTYLGVPCLTLRETTEKPVTIKDGTNLLVGNHSAIIMAHIERILHLTKVQEKIPEYWDGQSAKRIYQTLRQELTFHRWGVKNAL